MNPSTPRPSRGPAQPDSSEASFNVSVLRGVLSTDVRVTELPAGGLVHNFEVKAGGVEAQSVVPVAWHDPVRPPRLARGDEIVVVGSIRRRWFRSGGGSQSRTELVASCVAKSSSARARRALAAAVARLDASEVSQG